MGKPPWDYEDFLDRLDDSNMPYSPKYVFREGVEPVAYQVFPAAEGSEIIHESCAKTPSDREFPLYADDIEAARNLEPIVCDVCDGVIADAKNIL